MNLLMPESETSDRASTMAAANTAAGQFHLQKIQLNDGKNTL